MYIKIRIYRVHNGQNGTTSVNRATESVARRKGDIKRPGEGSAQGELAERKGWRVEASGPPSLETRHGCAVENPEIGTRNQAGRVRWS
jgi:hypothetical protein